MKDNFDTVFRNTIVRTKALEKRTETFSNLQMGSDSREHVMTNSFEVPTEVINEKEES